MTAVVGHADDVSVHLARVAAMLLENSSADGSEPPGLARFGGGDDNLTGGVRKAAPSTPSIRPFSAPQVKGFQLPGTTNLAPLTEFDDRCRAMVKIQDGCDGFCSYCIVAHVRNRLYSRPVAEVVAEVRTLVDAGHCEIVLCGVNLGAYGRDTVHRRGVDSSGPLVELIAAVEAVDGLARVRLSSVDPSDVDDELLGLIASIDTLCNHLHIALQSGSESILKRMNRRYSAGQFRETVDRIQEALPAPAITTDVIVGFPGESDADFDATMELSEYSGFAKMHLFPFSPRPGTQAATMEADRPAGEVVKRRLAALGALAERSAAKYRAKFVGKQVGVLVEEVSGAVAVAVAGLTERYLRTEIRGVGVERIGQIVPVNVTGTSDDGLVGEAAG